jgi:putative FmdB family regulatory protein
MPIYEYECPKCGRFDALQKMSAPALKKHDSCGSKVRKVMSASAFAFKGSGFYLTDYKKKSSSEVAKAEKGDKAEKGEKAAPKAECKAASPKSEACASCPAGKSAA